MDYMKIGLGFGKVAAPVDVACWLDLDNEMAGALASLAELWCRAASLLKISIRRRDECSRTFKCLADA